MSSERRAKSLLQDDREDSEPDSAPTEEAEAGPPFLPLRKSTRRNHLYDHEIKGSQAREITHTATQRVPKYVWCVK